MLKKIGNNKTLFLSVDGVEMKTGIVEPKLLSQLVTLRCLQNRLPFLSI